MIDRPVGRSRLPHLRRKEYPADFQQHEIEMCERVRPFTMTSDECILALMDAARYLVQHRVPGDFVECGVWKGGSMMAAALTLNALNQSQRHLWLYDTYEGMPPPSAHDITQNDVTAAKLLETHADFSDRPA